MSDDRSVRSERPTGPERPASDRTRGRRALLVGAAGAIASLAGCLGNPFEPGASADDPTDSSETATTDGGSDGDGTGTDGDGTGTDGDSDEPTGPPEPDVVVDVAAEDFQFTPEDFEIAAGQTVKWVWRSGGHNVRVASKPDGSDWTGTEGSNSDTYPEGHELVWTFETAGQYEYYCAPHRSLGLEGSFTVVEG